MDPAAHAERGQREEAIAKDPVRYARRMWRMKYVAVPLGVLWVIGLYGYVLTR